MLWLFYPKHFHVLSRTLDLRQSVLQLKKKTAKWTEKGGEQEIKLEMIYFLKRLWLPMAKFVNLIYFHLG